MTAYYEKLPPTKECPDGRHKFVTGVGDFEHVHYFPVKKEKGDTDPAITEDVIKFFNHYMRTSFNRIEGEFHEKYERKTNV